MCIHNGPKFIHMTNIWHILDTICTYQSQLIMIWYCLELFLELGPRALEQKKISSGRFCKQVFIIKHRVLFIMPCVTQNSGKDALCLPIFTSVSFPPNIFIFISYDLTYQSISHDYAYWNLFLLSRWNELPLWGKLSAISSCYMKRWQRGQMLLRYSAFVDLLVQPVNIWPTCLILPPWKSEEEFCGSSTCLIWARAYIFFIHFFYFTK